MSCTFTSSQSIVIHWCLSDLLNCSRVLTVCSLLIPAIAPMVQGAKGVSMNPADTNAQQNWRKANQTVRNIPSYPIRVYLTFIVLSHPIRVRV